MKFSISVATALLILAVACSAPATPDTEAAKSLAGRILGNASRHFVFEQLEADKDVFRIETRGGKTVISGNNANSMAVGLNHYLKYYCNVNVGWFVSDKVSLPARFPKLEQPVEVSARVPERFFLNYCTFGYTMPWWTWKDWEHFIDWMALNGVNLPLAITGQESIWYQIWTELGLTDEEVRSYFTGPAHLPWHRMLNIDRWGGPLPQSWLEGQTELQGCMEQATEGHLHRPHRSRPQPHPQPPSLVRPFFVVSLQRQVYLPERRPPRGNSPAVGGRRKRLGL